MDGHFVPNITFGIPVIKSIKGRFEDLPLDIHLMIDNPEKYIKDFAEFASILTVHYETCNHLDRTINSIKELGIKAFVSLNPHTSVKLLENVLPILDGVLIMSVNPGFGGQSFIPYSLDKIKELNDLRERRKLNFLIEVDGGVNVSLRDDLEKAGADILVAGSAVFKASNRLDAVRRLKGR
jgi:ribulose-phosphate 3-epimerase